MIVAMSLNHSLGWCSGLLLKNATTQSPGPSAYGRRGDDVTSVFSLPSEPWPRPVNCEGTAARRSQGSFLFFF